MSVVAVNPMSERYRPDNHPPKPEASLLQRHSKKFKALLGLGVLACVGAAGFVAGSMSKGSSADSDTSNSNQGSGDAVAELSATDQARRNLHSAMLNESNPAVSGKLSIALIEELVAKYNSNPSGWDDQYLTKDIMESFNTLRQDHYGRRALESNNLRRELIGSYDKTLVNAAWEAIEDETYSNAIVDGDDKVAVKRVGTECRIIAEESNSGTDWWSNLDTGSEDIKSIKTYNIQDESCGCASTTLWWCSTYKTCSTYKKIGVGYDGFIKTYNNVRLAVYNKVKSTCSTSDTLIFMGYSRGGAIVSALAFAFQVEGLWTSSKMKSVTFGSPRVLDDTASDQLHNAFTQYRMIFQDDIVPSIPYDWWGFKHFGTMRCYECGYAEERDRPFYSWNVGDHTSYCTYFGDATC